MFIRGKFVTNSSSSSFVGFGVWLEVSELKVLCASLMKGKGDEQIKRELYLSDKELQQFKKEPLLWFDTYRSPDIQDVLDKILPEIIATQAEWDDGLYLHVGMPEVHINFDSGVATLDCPEKIISRGRLLLDVLRETGLRDSLKDETNNSAVNILRQKGKTNE